MPQSILPRLLAIDPTRPGCIGLSALRGVATVDMKKLRADRPASRSQPFPTSGRLPVNPPAPGRLRCPIDSLAAICPRGRGAMHAPVSSPGRQRFGLLVLLRSLVGRPSDAASSLRRRSRLLWAATDGQRGGPLLAPNPGSVVPARGPAEPGALEGPDVRPVLAGARVALRPGPASVARHRLEPNPETDGR